MIWCLLKLCNCFLVPVSGSSWLFSTYGCFKQLVICHTVLYMFIYEAVFSTLLPDMNSKCYSLLFLC